MYILGHGVFAIGGTDIAVTRGGGQFIVERTNKEIIADGDFGPVKGRIRKDGARAMLTIRTLEIIGANLAKMYPAVEVDDAVSGMTTLTGKADIEDDDYNTTVSWTGVTDDGKSVVIELENAINLGNIVNWALVDKDEVVEELAYTGTYLPTARTTEPWSVSIIDA